MNNGLKKEHRILLAAHCRPIAHLRQQIAKDRLCLIFGAGAGYDLGFPKWEELLKLLGKDLEGFVEEENKADSEIGLGQLVVKLFERNFSKTNPAPILLDDALAQRAHAARLHADWRNHVHKALYDRVDPDNDLFVSKPCYYKSFIEIIKKSPLTISYNFDDSIERFLAANRQLGETTTKRGYTTIYDENSQLPTNAPIIYHPNGFLSHRRAEKSSPFLILSEDLFSEQLTDSIAGRHAVIQSELTQKTCLIIGCSLVDPTFNYLIKRNAQHHPGHFHYYIHWSGIDGESPCSTPNAERLFELYNLITLNLSTSEIHLLADLLSFAPEVLLQAIEKDGVESMFTYIVTGAVGSGKSSVISHFRSLKQHDEWLEPRLEGMQTQVEDIPLGELEAIDQWVDNQFAQKNSALHETENAIGIHILDRGPLDPLAFTKDGQVSRRAKSLREAMGRSKLHGKIVPAHVVLLKADPEEMEIRATSGGKTFSAANLTKQEEALKEVYGVGDGVTVLDTRGLSLHQVVKRVARVIHDRPYRETDISGRLNELKDWQLHLF